MQQSRAGARRALRVLGPADLHEVTSLLARDPVVNVVVDHRARSTRLEPRWLGGEVWGWYEDGALVSVCHSAANFIPAAATPRSLQEFAARARELPRRCSTILGPAGDVERLWALVEPAWGPAREVRCDQPHLETSGPPAVAADPLVRVSRVEDVPVLYPACVAMYSEEVGVSPEEGGGGPLYRARVTQLVARGWSFSRIEDGRVLFKAEVAAATPYACQIQGVYVAPDRRGEGLATAGMAAVVALALRHVAPTVSLYVNAHNEPARRAYERVGFRRTATFSTVMF